jgi:hypothetical protein
MSTTYAAPSISPSSNPLPLETNFLTLATAAHEKGFPVCPVHPAEKRGVFWAQYKHPATNRSEIMQLSIDYPRHNVGIVGRRGVSNLAFLDIDSKGTLERIETETGQKLPPTYTVQSRPESAPWKRHIYFRQTAYSVQKFDKEIHIADLSEPDEQGKYPSLFDMKGVGAGGFVVAAGSVRDTGEIYQDNGNVPVAPIPDWLVDWVLKERDKYRSESARLREKVKAQLTTAVQPGGSLVPKDHIRTAIKSRVGTFASLGVRRKTIERLVKEQIEDFFQDGAALAAQYKDLIHEEAVNPKLRIGRLRTEFLPKLPPRTMITKTPDGGFIIEMSLRRHEVMKEAIKTFPNRLKTSEVRARLTKALAAREFTLAGTKAEEKAIRRAMRQAGYLVTSSAGNERVWSRQTKKQADANGLPKRQHTYPL